VVDGGDGSADLVFSWEAVAGGFAYHVLQSTSPGFDGTVDLIDRTEGQTTTTVADRPGVTPPLLFFQVRSANDCNQESP
jgi:hypothetical protein